MADRTSFDRGTGLVDLESLDRNGADLSMDSMHKKSPLRGKGIGRVRSVCCYEAGYDGFWLHRVLVNHGVENHVLDPASLPIDRRAKHNQGRQHTPNVYYSGRL
jgi:hypothetical protein